MFRQLIRQALYISVYLVVYGADLERLLFNLVWYVSLRRLHSPFPLLVPQVCDPSSSLRVCASERMYEDGRYAVVAMEVDRKGVHITACGSLALDVPRRNLRSFVCVSGEKV